MSVTRLVAMKVLLKSFCLVSSHFRPFFSIHHCHIYEVQQLLQRAKCNSDILLRNEQPLQILVPSSGLIEEDNLDQLTFFSGVHS